MHRVFVLLLSVSYYLLGFTQGCEVDQISATPTPTPAWKNRLRLQLRLRPTSVSFHMSKDNVLKQLYLLYAMPLMQNIVCKLDNKVQ